MSSTVVLIDFENVQKLDLHFLPAEAKALFFVGAVQHSIPFALVQETHPRGVQVEWIKVEEVGSTAVDSIINFYFGWLANQEPAAEYLIVSKDRGFDVLLRHAASLNIKCRRVATLALEEQEEGAIEAEVSRTLEVRQVAPTTEISKAEMLSLYQRALALLTKLSPRCRPKTRKKLLATLASYFRTEPPAVAERILQRLYSARKVTEEGGKLEYGLD